MRVQAGHGRACVRAEMPTKKWKEVFKTGVFNPLLSGAQTKTSLLLSSPAAGQAVGPLEHKKCAHQDLNLEPTDYESVALTD